MQLMPFPEIEKSELEAVRQFLTSDRDAVRKVQVPRILQESKGVVTLRHGIARARLRSGLKVQR